MYTKGPALPLLAPLAGGTGSSSYVDTGGYDVLIGGYGFRLATDQNDPYSVQSEDVSIHRFDNSLEPGEQTLAALPWIKSQASFHAGAGQLNLEQGFTAFQYQQEQVEHIRFDTCLNVDPWTPGKVSRLPDCRFTARSLSSALTATYHAFATASVSGVDTAVLGGVGTLVMVSWGSGPNSAPTFSNVDLSGADFTGASNCSIVSLTTDGVNYYASVKLTAAVGGQSAYIIKGAMGSTTAPVAIYNCGTATGIVGWEKARLMAGLANSVYELNPTASAHTVLPTANYTHPVSGWTWTATAESPTGILFAGTVGGSSAIHELTLSSAGATPTLTGGNVVARLPKGETILSLQDVVGSFLAVGTSSGLRLASYDTYTGKIGMGPLSVSTTSSVWDLETRDRFVFGSYTSQQPDGSTGVVTMDATMIVDTAGRNAYAPGLKSGTAATITNPTVWFVNALPVSNRLVFVTGDGLFVEGGSAGSDGDAYLRTSRIRFDTVEPKVFKSGRIRGTLNVGQVKVVALEPYSLSTNVGTFGGTTMDPGPFALPTDPMEWQQLEFHLLGSSAVLNSYQVKAFPSPTSPNLITMTLNCFATEFDRYQNEVIDIETPRQRFGHLQDLKDAGAQIQLVEFTNAAPVVTNVMIDALQFQVFSPPDPDSDIGGKVNIRFRTTDQ